jgi:cytidylate kinase
MSVVAISQAMGSQGDEIGLILAERLGHEFAEREIILKAAERFGEGVRALEHVTDERPSAWERFAQTRQRYLAYVEAVIWEFAGRERVVLVGRGSPFVLAGVHHVLLVRVTAPPDVRARRIATRDGLTMEAAADLVRRSDRDRAARVRFLYHADWNDPFHYHLVLNTAGLGVLDAVDLLEHAVGQERFRPTAGSQQGVVDRGAVAGARAALLADVRTRRFWLDALECREGVLTLRGVADREEVRVLAGALSAQIPGVTAVANEIVIAPDGTLGSTYPR